MNKLFSFYFKKIYLIQVPLLIISLLISVCFGFYLNKYIYYILYSCNTVQEALSSSLFTTNLALLIVLIILFIISFFIYFISINRIKNSRFKNFDIILPYLEENKYIVLKTSGSIVFGSLFILNLIGIVTINIYLDYSTYHDAFLIFNSIKNNINDVIPLPLINIMIIYFDLYLLANNISLFNFDTFYKKNKISILFFIIYLILFFANYVFFKNYIIIANTINFLFGLSYSLYSFCFK
jgi:hypothetical protein